MTKHKLVAILSLLCSHPFRVISIVVGNISAQSPHNNHRQDTGQKEYHNQGIDNAKPMDLHIPMFQINIPSGSPFHIAGFPVHRIRKQHLGCTCRYAKFCRLPHNQMTNPPLQTYRFHWLEAVSWLLASCICFHRPWQFDNLPVTHCSLPPHNQQFGDAPHSRPLYDTLASVEGDYSSKPSRPSHLQACNPLHIGAHHCPPSKIL